MSSVEPNTVNYAIRPNQVIVEFIGCTGAGKTTLISAVRSRLAQITDVTDSFDAVAGLLHLPRTSNPTARNLTQELIGLPFFIRSLYTNREFLTFVLKCLSRRTRFPWFNTRYLRSIERKIGTFEILRRLPSSRVVVVDEGTLHYAHILFVYTTTDSKVEDISQFARLVPLPDVAVYVRAPVETLVERCLLRADPPRELRTKNKDLIARYVRQAVTVFDQIAEAEEIRDRVIVVENEACTDDERVATVDRIAKFIADRVQTARESVTQ